MGSQLRPHRDRRRWALLLVAPVLLTAGLLWGLTNALAESGSPSPTTGKVVLHVGIAGTEPDNLNPFIGYATPSYEIWHLNYDMLYGYSAKDFSPVPELAAEMPQVSPDGKTITVKLRSGVKWQDGVPFTAKDVAFTYNYIIDNNMGYLSGYTLLIKSVEAVDDTTVVFHLTKPKANFERMWVVILPEHIWSKVPPKAAQNTYANKPPIIGTGPFQTVRTEGNLQTVVMDANPGYWRGRPKIDEIVFNVYQNPDNMVSDLRSGVIDVAYGVPPAQMLGLKSETNVAAIAFTTRTFNYLGMNCYAKPTSLGNPVLRDERFRQALSWAVDKQRLIDTAEMGFAVPGDTVIVGAKAGSIDYHYSVPGDQQSTFDLDKARAALDAAGYTDSDGDGIRDYKGKPIELRLWARNQSDFSQKVGRLLTGWFRSIGLKIAFSVMDEGVINDRLYNTTKSGAYAPDYDMYIWDWFGYADPGDTLVSWTTQQIYNGWNDACWSNQEYDTLFDQQQSMVDLQTGAFDNVARRDVVWKMQDIFYKSSPYIVLDYPQTLEAYNTSKWQGWVRPNNEGVIMLNDNIDTYLSINPKTAAATTGGGGANTTLVVLGIIIAAAVVGLIVWLVRRRRGSRAEEV
jgi:peptide/nickel transport system substrate-binding protein